MLTRMPAICTQLRHEKEAASLVQWQAHVRNMRSMAQLHAWLHDTHLCYAVGRQHEFSRRTIQDPKLLASY